MGNHEMRCEIIVLYVDRGMERIRVFITTMRMVYALLSADE
jgi:hypothetical protein